MMLDCSTPKAPIFSRENKPFKLLFQGPGRQYMSI